LAASAAPRTTPATRRTEPMPSADQRARAFRASTHMTRSVLRGAAAPSRATAPPWTRTARLPGAIALRAGVALLVSRVMRRTVNTPNACQIATTARLVIGGAARFSPLLQPPQLEGLAPQQLRQHRHPRLRPLHYPTSQRLVRTGMHTATVGLRSVSARGIQCTCTPLALSHVGSASKEGPALRMPPCGQYKACGTACPCCSHLLRSPLLLARCAPHPPN